MTDLSKSLELSLWNSDFNDITKDIIECSIDSLIDNEFIKQIPIIKKRATLVAPLFTLLL